VKNRIKNPPLGGEGEEPLVTEGGLVLRAERGDFITEKEKQTDSERNLLEKSGRLTGLIFERQLNQGKK